jgi:F-type H+-transporting ATPase subunit gamma
MPSQRDVRSKIGSVKNIQKITRALETVAAARLRRAEQRIEALRPYANAIRRMTRQAAQAAGGAEAARVPLLAAHETTTHVGVLVVTGDRGLAGAFNSQVIRAGVRIAGEIDHEGLRGRWFAAGRRGVSSLTFRGFELQGSYVGFSDRPAYADARTIADDLVTAYVDGSVDRVDMIFNSYISPLRQVVTQERLLPLAQATIVGEDESDLPEEEPSRASVEYEPEPEAILRRLLPDYVEISIYRALLESAAGFYGAQMTAMRSASDNAEELISDLTLEMNRARQAEITQEILEVVAGAQGLS